MTEPTVRIGGETAGKELAVGYGAVAAVAALVAGAFWFVYLCGRVGGFWRGRKSSAYYTAERKGGGTR